MIRMPVDARRWCGGVALTLVRIAAIGWWSGLIVAAISATAWGQSSAANQSVVAGDPSNAAAGPLAVSESTGSQIERPTLRLPPALPDGRPLRPIALFMSQMDELIPDDYRPVSIDQLREAITRLANRATDDSASRLKSAMYRIEVEDDTLVSRRSVIDIESDRPGEVRRSLGKVNLAIEPPQARSAEALLGAVPRLESEPDGNLVAVFRGNAGAGSGIEFRWRLNGQVSGTGHEFTLQLPRTPQTRIVLSAPEMVTVEALDGVLRSRPGPPPDAGEFSTNRSLRWYEIDAGGLSLVRLRTRQPRAATERGSFVVRRSSVQYEVDLGGLSWSCRMVVQLPSDLQLPRLRVDGTTVSSVKVNASEVPFTSKLVGGQSKELQLEMPPGFSGAETAAVNVTVSGYSSWSTELGWCDLPKPIWIGQDIVHASAVDEVQLAVLDPLRVMTWELPTEWKQLQQQRLEGGVSLLSADGPPILPGPSPDAPFELPTKPWSRVRLTLVDDLLASDSLLRLQVNSGLLTAKARLSVTVDPDRAGPLRVLVEPAWSLESVIFARSGRVVEHAGVSEQSPTLDLWPEAEDADEGRIVIELTGSRGLANAAGGLTIPPTWFTRVDDVRGPVLAAILPPADLNWSGEAAMERGRIKAPQLTAEQSQFMGVMSPETLWFRPDAGRTPSILLQTPSVSYNAASVLELRLDEGDIVEQLRVKVESQSQSLRQLVVHTGPADGRPDLVWSISGSDDGPAINLPSSDVSVGRGDEDGVYTIDVSEMSLRGRQLLARRRYVARNQFSVTLPSVPGAASQDSDALIDADLTVENRPRSVQLVPLSPAALAQDVQTNSSGGVVAASSDAQLSSRDWTRLRYDAVEQPSILLAKVSSNPDVTIVWREQVHVVASSRGTDRVEATYTVSPAAPFEIDADPLLQLASVSRDGIPVDLTTLTQRPIVLQPRFKSEEIRVAWDRSQFGSGWLRRCRIPRIRVSGTVLRSEYELVASSDSFTPAALLGSRSDEGAFIKVRPGDSLILFRRNTLLATGWLFAILVFALAWYIAERAPVLVVSLLVLASAVLLLWWPWRLAIIGWLIVPMIAAAMLSTSRARGQLGQRKSDRGACTTHGGQHGSAAHEMLSDPTVRPLPRSLVPWGVILIGGGIAATAQEARQSVAESRLAAINVLVPVLETGKLSGEMVYIPQTVYRELFRSSISTVPQDARFQSAGYRVRVNPAVTTGDQVIFSSVEAEYQIHFAGGDQSANLVRLPLAANSLRRLELIDEVSRIVPFEADSMGQVIATLPRGSAFKIHATLRPMVTQSDQWIRLLLAIPPVASSRLTIESEQNVDAIRVGGAAGRLLSEESQQLRRWVKEIGPTRNLEIDVRLNETGLNDPPRGLGRRYWVHAGKRQATIDCEVDPPNSIAAGESFQFVVRDSAMPNVISPYWRFKGSELYSPTRRLITLESTRDSPGPIRLLWTQPLSWGSDTTSHSVGIRIPEVIAAALGANSDAWIAMHCDSALQFAPMIRETTEPLSVDQFLASWTGYHGPIDRAFVPIGDIPTPQLQAKPIGSVKIEQSHHLHVMPDRLELSYRATLTPGDSLRNLYRLQVPHSLELSRVTVRGLELVEQSLDSGDSREILLGDFAGTEPVNVEVVAVQSLKPNVPFTPPRFSILPHAPTLEEYRISRDRSTSLKVVRKPTVEPIAAHEVAMAESLARGWIPVSIWNTRGEYRSLTAENPGGAFEVQTQPTRFDCDQLIVLSRVDSRWSMETFVKFGRRVPEFVDIEVPASWCEGLEVNPVTALSRQQAIDPTRQVIRVHCDRSTLVDNTLTIRGKLISAETGRVSVPSVRVLGFGQRRIHVSVPSRLANEFVQWRTSAVEGDALPERWASKIDLSSRSTYVVANPSWSIDLAPLPEIDADAVALSFDAQTFPQEDGVLVMCHWDLFPGSLEAIDLQLPEGARCIGAWSAGKSVVPGLHLDPTSGEPVAGMLRVPLALSRLSQPMEVLVRVPSAVARQPGYVPQLVGIPVTRSWLTNYAPADAQRPIWGDAPQPSQDRALALAGSVVDAIDAVGFINQRPRDEVITWLRLWFTRYRMIAESGGHQIMLNSSVSAIETLAAMSSAVDQQGDVEAQSSLAIESQWEALDARMAGYAQQFFADVDEQVIEQSDAGAFLFGVGGFDGFVPGRVSQPNGFDPPRAVQSTYRADQGLRLLITNALTVLLTGGLLVALRPLRRRVRPAASHPAFWLALLGLFGFVVAPIPVAASLLLVAVALPVFPRRFAMTPSIR